MDTEIFGQFKTEQEAAQYLQDMGGKVVFVTENLRWEPLKKP